MDNDPIVRHYLTLDETVKFIKKNRRGRQVYIRISIFGYTQLPDDDDSYRGFDMTGLVPVGAKVAISTTIDAAKTFAERKNVKIAVGLSRGCLFIS